MARKVLFLEQTQKNDFEFIESMYNWIQTAFCICLLLFPSCISSLWVQLIFSLITKEMGMDFACLGIVIVFCQPVLFMNEKYQRRQVDLTTLVEVGNGSSLSLEDEFLAKTEVYIIVTIRNDR